MVFLLVRLKSYLNPKWKLINLMGYKLELKFR